MFEEWAQLGRLGSWDGLERWGRKALWGLTDWLCGLRQVISLLSASVYLYNGSNITSFHPCDVNQPA